MKTTKLEHDLLLSESGELSARRRKRLDAAIAASPELQERVRILKAWRTLWKDVSATTPLPADDRMRRIHHAITSTRQEQHKGATVLPFLLPFRRPLRVSAIAAAAALFLAIGLYLAIAPPRHPIPIAIADASVNDLDARIEDVLDDIDASLLTLLDSLAGNAEESDALALELINMEDS